MPMRLPTTRPTGQIEAYLPRRHLALGQSHLSASWEWDQLLPAGVGERAVATIQALADCRYRAYWRRGALCRFGSHTALLLELTELEDERVTLTVDVRGRGQECWALLAQLAPRLATLLTESFPGLYVHSQLACPGCLSRGEWGCPSRWPLTPLLQMAEHSSPHSVCKACDADVPLAQPPAAQAQGLQAAPRRLRSGDEATGDADGEDYPQWLSDADAFQRATQLSGGMEGRV